MSESRFRRAMATTGLPDDLSKKEFINDSC